MKIPHSSLSPAVLKEVVLEFVTRDGTDHSEVERRVIKVLKQLDNGVVELHFDNESSSCNIAAAQE